LKLKPGMTANITAIVAERHNVLAVPNAALRFRPENAAATAIPAGRGPMVWKVDGDKVEPVRVRLGITDGISSEVVSGNLAEGDQIAVPAQSNTKTQTAPSRSMFPMGGRGGRH
jgi:HlyD family secretion protein